MRHPQVTLPSSFSRGFLPGASFSCPATTLVKQGFGVCAPNLQRKPGLHLSPDKNEIELNGLQMQKTCSHAWCKIFPGHTIVYGVKIKRMGQNVQLVRQSALTKDIVHSFGNRCDCDLPWHTVTCRGIFPSSELQRLLSFTCTAYTSLSSTLICRFAWSLRGKVLLQGEVHHATLQTGCPYRWSLTGDTPLQGWSLTGVYTVLRAAEQTPGTRALQCLQDFPRCAICACRSVGSRTL